MKNRFLLQGIITILLGFLSVLSFFPETYFPENTSFFVATVDHIEERGDSLLVSVIKDQERFIVPIYLSAIEKEYFHLENRDIVVVQKKDNSDKMGEYFFIGIYFIPWIVTIFSLFCIIMIWSFGLRSLKPFFALLVSILFLGYILFPNLLLGNNIFLWGILGTSLLSILSLFISHGINKCSFGAAFSSFITFISIYFLSQYGVSLFHLFGYGGYNISSLGFEYTNINLSGIFLVGMFLGTIGVIDDVTITQSASAQELQRTNPKISFLEMFAATMNIGKSHMFSMINTLFFAYIGASVSLYVYLYSLEKPWWVIINSPFFQEEFIRIFIGVFALIFCVPITSFVTSQVFTKKITV